MKKNNENEEKQLQDGEISINEGKKKSKKTKTVVIVVIVAVVVLVLAFVLGNAVMKMSQNMQDQMNAMMGDGDGTYTVDKQDVEQEITTSGTVIGVEKKAYISPVTAKVEDICVEVGQTVSKGDILLTYDSSDLGDDLEKVKIQAQSEKAAGNASYEVANEAASKASAAKKKVESLKEDIKKLKKEIAALEKKVAAYEEQIEAAKQVEQVVEGEETTEQTTEQTTEESSVDMKAYNKAVSDLEKKNATLAEKQQSLAEQESIVAANEDVKVSDSEKAQISAANQLSDMNVNEAQKSLDAAEAGITALSSGIVESIDVIKGAYANETQTLMTIIDSDKIGVEFSISKDDLGSISKGQKARVVISGNEYEGTVDFVSRVASGDMQLSSNQTAGGTIKGRILLDDPDEKIYIGVSAKVYIFVGKSEKTLVIPYEALNTDVDGDFVYIVNKENLIERKDVTLGIYSDEYYEVLEGLAEGDKVILDVTSDMKPGDEYIGNAMNGTMVVE